MKRQYLTDFELMVLLAILRVGEDSYGVSVAREIEVTGERPVLLGAVYAALDRLEVRGLVSSRVGEPTAERGGRAKRYFAVTAPGVRAVQETQRALTALSKGIAVLKRRPA